MYWRLETLPELQHLTEYERNKLLRQHVGRWFSARILLRCILRGLGLSFIAAAVTMSGLQPNIAQTIALYVFACVVSVWPIATVALYQFYLIRVRGQLRIYLEERKRQGLRLPICVRCGYALHNNANQCTECGAPA